MAATTQIALPPRTAGPLALWHLLSLDAPTVAALWSWFIARSCHTALPLTEPLALAIAVWIIYAADRLLDARHRNTAHHILEPRHLFHHRHRRAFLTGIALAILALAALLPHLNPVVLRLSLVEGVLLLTWLLILNTLPVVHRMPKEIVVGLFFTAAFIPTVAREPTLILALLPSAILFSALCSLNALFIYRWEHDGPTLPDSTHITTRLALAHLPTLALVLAGAAAAFAVFDSPRPIPAAAAVAVLLLLILDRNHSHISRTNLRAAADLALLTPLLLLPFLR